MTLHSIAGRTKRKTTLVEKLCKAMRERWDLVVVTSDIDTKEDRRLLTVAGALAPEPIVGVETGGCPHAAIREDASTDLAPCVGADVAVMEAGTQRMRPTRADRRPYVMTNLHPGTGRDTVVRLIEQRGLLKA